VCKVTEAGFVGREGGREMARASTDIRKWWSLKGKGKKEERDVWWRERDGIWDLDLRGGLPPSPNWWAVRFGVTGGQT